MKDELTLRDFYLFLKHNLKLILTIGIAMSLLGILFALYNYFSDAPSGDSSEPREEEFSGLSRERFEELAQLPFEYISDEDVELMQAYQRQTAYSFMIFVTNEAGEPVGNLSMMRALFRHDFAVDRASEIIGETFTPDPILAVNIQSYGDEGLYDLQFGREDEEKSEELAQAYYELVENGEIFALNNLEVSIYEDSPIPVGQMPDEDDEDYVSPAVSHSPRSLIRNSIIYGVAALAAGLFFGIVIALINLLFSKKVSTLYDYIREDSDKVVRLSHLREVSSDQRLQKAFKNIAFPKNNRKIILVESNFSNEIKTSLEKFLNEMPNGDQKDITFNTDFSDVNEEVDEVIILTKTNETTKDWYNNQRVQLNGYRFPIKVIQF